MANDVRRRWSALAIFLCGLAVGAGGMSSMNMAPQAPAAIERVGGWDTYAAAAAAPAVASTEVAPQPAPRVDEPDHAPLAPRALARRALGFTVFIHGGRIYGAGALVDDQGHVLTCRHVVEDLERVTVAFSDGASFSARVVDSDPKLDLALLRIDGAGKRAPAEPASIASVEAGDDLFALGAPRKLTFSLARGMASFVGRPYAGAHYLQSDLPMNAGNSGGPVLDDRGKLVAIASFVLRDSEGLAFALPIDYAYRRFRGALEMPPAFEKKAGAFEKWLAGRAPAREGAAERD